MNGWRGCVTCLKMLAQHVWTSFSGCGDSSWWCHPQSVATEVCCDFVNLNYLIFSVHARTFARSVTSIRVLCYLVDSVAIASYRKLFKNATSADVCHVHQALRMDQVPIARSRWNGGSLRVCLTHFIVRRSSWKYNPKR